MEAGWLDSAEQWCRACCTASHGQKANDQDENVDLVHSYLLPIGTLAEDYYFRGRPGVFNQPDYFIQLPSRPLLTNGRDTLKQAPSSLSHNSIAPPLASTYSRTMASPNPVPS